MYLLGRSSGVRGLYVSDELLSEKLTEKEKSG